MVIGGYSVGVNIVIVVCMMVKEKNEIFFKC